ncbi:MAG: hypothetical protein GY941_12655 [Planctomycetes bacterium]|nr:hypothetical protein [Planctomycetota bacterium]
MARLMTNEVLREENLAYVGTGGVSPENQSIGFHPAFYDLVTGCGHFSRFANGTLAPIHVLDGLPEEWIIKRDQSGEVRTVKDSVIAGFIRGGYFYTREQAAQYVRH